MPVTKLAPAELEHDLLSLPDWQRRGDRIVRAYQFRDFVDAFAFMTAAALHVQAVDHHPEWSNVYSTVRVELTTHDAGGVSARDIDLARRLEALWARWPK